MTATLIEPTTDLRTELANGEVAHIVRRDPADPRSAAAIVLEARVEGLPLTALCGYVWVPSKDPKRLPVCSRCEERLGDDERIPEGFNPQGLPS